MVIELAIKLGTSNTSIFMSGSGIVLYEPSMVAFFGEPKQKKVRAVGIEAYQMIGKTPDKTTLISPIIDGVVVEFDSCVCMLKEFLSKILPQTFFAPKIKVVLCVPTGLTVDERKMYEEICLKCGIREVTMVESIIACAIGLDLPINTNNGGVVVSIGGGITEIAVLSLSGIVSGCSVSIGGNMMDKALLDFINGKHSMKIGLYSARKLKVEIGSLFASDMSEMKVNGVEVMTKNLASVNILATDVMEALLPYYLRVADAIESVINMCPPELASDIYKKGVFFCGGASQMVGMLELMSSRLKLQAYLGEEPTFAAIQGAGKLLKDKQLLNDILMQN